MVVQVQRSRLNAKAEIALGIPMTLSAYVLNVWISPRSYRNIAVPEQLPMAADGRYLRALS